MNISGFILTAAIFGGGFFFQSLFGFGAAFIVVLGLSLLMPIQSVIAILPISMIIAAGLVVIRDRTDVQWKRILRTVAISAPGTIGGALVMNRLNSRFLIILICGLILLYSLYSLFVKWIELPEFMEIPYLLISGLVISLTGLGIVYVPFVMQTIRKPAELRASLHLLWVLLGSLRIPLYIGTGAVNGDSLLIGLSVIPVIFVFQFFGKKLHDRMNTGTYHRGILIFIGIIVCIRLVIEINAMINGTA